VQKHEQLMFMSIPDLNVCVCNLI